MPTECSQLLATAFSLEELKSAPKCKDGTDRLHFNPKHPCAIYTRNTLQNFNWVLIHAFCLCQEYFCRYKREHFQIDFILWCGNNANKINFPKSGLENVPLAMPDKYKTEKEDYKCYQNYINGEKEYSRWPSVELIPFWFKDRSEKYVDKNFVNGSYIKR